MAAEPSRRVMRMPFGVDERGHIAWVSDPVKISRQALISIIATQPHERVMRPDYGVDTKRLLFDQMHGADVTQLQQDVLTATARYAPDLDVQTVVPLFPDNLPESAVEIHISYVATINGVPLTDTLNATVPVGG